MLALAEIEPKDLPRSYFTLLGGLLFLLLVAWCTVYRLIVAVLLVLLLLLLLYTSFVAFSSSLSHPSRHVSIA